MTGAEYLRLFGKGLANARGKRGLSQADAAVLLEIHPVSLSQYERGLHQPRPPILLKMSEVYQMPVIDLFTLAFGRVYEEGIPPDMTVSQVVGALEAFVAKHKQ